MAVVAYRSAPLAAASSCEHVPAAFDMHRVEPLAQLQMPMPVTADKERHIWAHAVRFLRASRAALRALALKVPLWVDAMVVVALIAVAVLVAGSLRTQETYRVVVAARALPAFHLVGRADLKVDPLKNVAHEPTHLSEVVGTVTKEMVAAGAPFANGTITGHTSRKSLADLVFIRFHATAVQLPGIGPGDDVELGFAPVAAAVGSRAGSISALLIDDTTPTSGPATYVVAIRNQDVEWFLNLVGRSRMIVFRGSLSPRLEGERAPARSSVAQRPAQRS